MRAGPHMKAVLEATGLYSFPGGAPAGWELDAMGAGFALLEDRFNGLLGDLFAATAGSARLNAWEALLRPQPSQGSLAQRRQWLTCRLALGPGGFTPARVQAMLPGAGVQGLVLEDGEGGLTVALGRLLGVTKAQAEKELSRLLPAHLPWQWDEGVSWLALDAYPRPFGEWDALALSWERLDAVTRQDLENSFAEEE